MLPTQPLFLTPRFARRRRFLVAERKRANIGVELVKSPSCIFLDEPTSGLDSFQAQSVMSAMKRLASSGRTVIASIHQPRSSIYQMFDQLLLIAEGRCVYYGDATSAVPYFGGKGHACPSLYNPADYFMDVVSPDYRSKELEKESLGRIDTLSREWSTTSASSTSDPESGDFARTSLSTSPFSLSMSEFSIQSSWPRQFSLCFSRNVTTLSRNKTATMGKVFGGIFFGIVLGAIYSDSGYNQKR